jgi:hypothetical protein
MNYFAQKLLLLIAVLHVARTSAERSHLRGLRTAYSQAECADNDPDKKDCGDGLCITTTLPSLITRFDSFDMCKYCLYRKDSGYRATGLDVNGELICENIDECASDTHDCNLETEDCIDIEGDYRCKSKTFLNLEVRQPEEGENVLEVIGTSDDEWLGYSVSSAGDVNGDGINDLIIGSPSKDSLDEFQAGAAYILFGRADGSFPTTDELDGTQGFAVFGKRLNDRLGASVSAAGDINGDGFADIIIGAPGVDIGMPPGMGANDKPWCGVTENQPFHGNGGEAYVIYGSNNAFPAYLSACDIDGTNGFIIQGKFRNNNLGNSVSYAGDVNNDGFSDVIVGAQYANPSDIFNAGEAYVIFGGATDPDTPVLSINALTGKNGFIIEGGAERIELGTSVSFAGDLNNDGIDDVIVGAPNAVNSDGVSSGAAYVVYGKSTEVSQFDLRVKTAELSGADGFSIFGNDRSRLGFSVAYAGDVNGDTIDDVIIGAPRANVSPIFGSGDAYIVYGTQGDAPFSPLSTLDTGITTIVGKASIDGFGYSVKSAGDVNGDGIDDVIIGAPYGTDGYNAEAYVVYGSTAEAFLPEVMNAADLNESVGMTIPILAEDFDGSNGYRISVSSAGDLNGDGKADLIVGVASVERSDNSKEGHVQIIRSP